MYWFILLVICAVTGVFSKGLWEFFGVRMDGWNYEPPVGDISVLPFKAALIALLACAVLTGIATRQHLFYSQEKKEERYKMKPRLMITYLVVTLIGLFFSLFGFGQTENGYLADIAAFGILKCAGCLLLILVLGTLLCLGPALFARKPPQKEKPALVVKAAAARDGKNFTHISDRELFPALFSSFSGEELYDDYILEIEQKKHDYYDFSNSSSDISLDSELGEKPHLLWTKLDRWLIERVLGDGTVDSFPPDSYVLGELYHRETETRTRYDPDLEDYDTTTKVESATDKITVDYFYQMWKTLNLLEKERDDGSGTYELLQPVYRALHQPSGEQAKKDMLSTVVWLAVLVPLFIGIQLLRNLNPAAFWGIILLLAQIAIAFVVIVGLFVFFGALSKYCYAKKQRSMINQYRKTADKNMPAIYRLLRYYHLWEKQTGRTYEAVRMMQSIVDEYLQTYPQK